MAVNLKADGKSVGHPLDRVDGRLKVTGGARYTAEWKLENVAYGALVTSTIASGRVTSIDTRAAEAAPGMVTVITHRNALRLRSQEQKQRPGVDPAVGTPLSPLQDDVVRYNGQPVAVVVADTFERAAQAARLIRVNYAHDRAITTFRHAEANAFLPSEARIAGRGEKRSADYRRGDPDSAFAAAEVRVEQNYSTVPNHHNAMEPHATTAAWEGDKLVLYDKTQWVDNVGEQIALAFGLKTADVRVISPFVGGAFGAALRAWPHVLIAALAARQVRRPVKLVLTRAQVFVVPGYRPETAQKVSLGATRDGKLTATRHNGTGQTSMYEEYTESLLDATRLFYACPNLSTRYRLARMHVNTPASMRAPGESSGMFALESAMDELAVALHLDPIELRLRNHADVDPETGHPWSSKSLKECYAQAAERFGWSRRNPEPRSMRDGHQLIGYGMASATWSTNRQPATVRVRLLSDGTALVQTAASDIGPGTYTVMTQIAADALGMSFDKVRFELGDTRFPKAPVEGGSMTVASVGSAVHEVALAARARACELASRDPASPLHQTPADEISVEAGVLFAVQESSRRESYVDLLKRHGQDAVDITQESKPAAGAKKFTTRAFGAHFVEVRVDADFATVRVARVVSAFAAGRIINPKTAGSQAIGGIVGGIGMALLEEGVRDERNARIVNDNLADYHMPVHADIPAIDAFYIDEHDPHVNPIGAKGLAELSLCGVAAAVANAVYHATGKRVRDLPITPEKLL
jgi:xanthine dehydrogenase YagR molybdenum-binding subunit